MKEKAVVNNELDTEMEKPSPKLRKDSNVMEGIRYTALTAEQRVTSSRIGSKP